MAVWRVVSVLLMYPQNSALRLSRLMTQSYLCYASVTWMVKYNIKVDLKEMCVCVCGVDLSAVSSE